VIAARHSFSVQDIERTSVDVAAAPATIPIFHLGATAAKGLLPQS
jgi:hypothetical protein